jgi:hypothetical protein
MDTLRMRPAPIDEQNSPICCAHHMQSMCSTSGSGPGGLQTCMGSSGTVADHHKLRGGLPTYDAEEVTTLVGRRRGEQCTLHAVQQSHCQRPRR